ncbi:hypothetical protein FA044_18275 [Salmonella enterica]|nr:hypothetical protein [Salmonella enterica]ECJ3109598.1 hypothetical protein [Salmonella enterica]
MKTMSQRIDSAPFLQNGLGPRLTMWLVWLNIVMQILFPLAGVFTPAIVHAQQHKQQQGSQDTGVSAQRTQVYILGQGESVQSVARKFNLTVTELRNLNQLRTFAHGFSALKAGDELDVPYQSNGKSSLKNDKKLSQNNIDSDAQKGAQLASQAGSFFANSPSGNAAADMARGMATGAASSSVQQWLSQFGNARVQLDADDHFSLKNSQFDLLVPLWERKDKLVFTQGSIHRTDDRMQSNLGLGMRYFGSDYMVGGNTFLDYDFSGSHARSGLGLEYGRDYLKLAANGYLRLTGWKDSGDVEDYEARPANGWDLRAEGWLPVMPQLGGKLTYEQYYGDEVALFGKDNRQRDPHAITVGLNYTPVPLLTLNAEQRQGQDGKKDSRFGLEMNYQLGVPWVHQVDPGSVAAMRSLDGARYDLVDRNNNIVLEYRKKEVIRLKMADLIIGYAGEQKSLGVSVNSQHGVRQIDWSAPALLAAGGKIVGAATDYSVILPAYQYGDAAVNTYMVTATAVDQKGNRSEPSQTQVTVNASEISTTYSSFKSTSGKSASSNLYLPADGISAGVLTLKLEDDQQQPVDVPVDELTLAIDTGPLPQPRLRAVKSETVQEAKVSGFIRKSAGVFDVTVTAGTRDEQLTLTPSVRKTALSAAKVYIRKNAPDAGQSTFAASPKTLTADNTATSILTLTAKDASGNALTGIAASLNVAVTGSDGHTPVGGNVTVTSVTETDTAGVYTATLKGTLADTYTVKPQFSGNVIGSLSDTVTLTAGTTPDEKQSTFVASPKFLAADNTATSTLILTAKDTNGNAIASLAGSLSLVVTDTNGSAPAEGQVTVSSVTETATTGVYSATLKGTLAGTYTIKPLFGGSAIGSLNDTVTLTAGTTPDEKQSTFVIDPKILPADNSATSTLTFTAKDANGNMLVGIAGSLSFGITDSHGATPAEGKVTISSVTETATAGVYTATLKGTLAGTYTIKPQFSGSAVGSLSDTVSLAAGTTPDAGQSAFVVSPGAIEADGVEISTLTLTVKDTFGNAIAGIGSSLRVDITDSNGNHPTESSVIVSSVSESAIPGVYTATLKGTHADTYTLRPQFNGSNIGSLSDTVTLTASVIPDGSQSTFSVEPGTIPADDKTTSTLLLTVKDSNGNAITGMPDNVSFAIAGHDGSEPAAGKVTVSSVMETATPGVYTATLKGQRADTYTVKPVFRGSVISGLSGTVTLTAGSTPDGLKSAFATSPASIPADDSTTSTLTFSAQDAFGNAIPGITGQVKFVVTDSHNSTPATGKVTVSSITESATPGVYTATLKGQLADTYTIKPQVNGSDVGSLSGTVTLTAGSTPDGSQSAFTAAPASIVADDTTTSLLTFTAKDAFGNVIGGIAADKLRFVVTGHDGSTPATGKVTVSSITESATPGVYTATLKGQLADTYTVKPQFSGSDVGNLGVTVELTTDTSPDAAHSLFAASPSVITADNVETSTLTLVAKDHFGNLIPGIAGSVSFLVMPVAEGKVTVSNVSETTRGNYTATLQGTLAGTYTVVPQISGATLGGLTDTVVLKAGTTPDAGQSAFVATPASIVADGMESSNLLLTVRDPYGNNISGIASRLSLKVTDSQSGTDAGAGITVSELTETAAPGVYRATLKGTQSGSLKVVPQADGVAMGNLNGTVILMAGAPDGSKSTFAASPTAIVADDNTTSLLTFTAEDASGNAIPGIAGSVNFIITDSHNSTPATGKVTVSSITESATPGVYTATLKGQLADSYTIKPQVNGSNVGSLSGTVTLTAGSTPASSQSAFTTAPASIVADDSTTSLLTFTAKDMFGNTIGGITADKLSFIVTDSKGSTPATGKVTVSSIIETATPGIYTATLKGQLADTYTIKPQFSGSDVGSLSGTVTLTAGSTPDGSQSAFTAAPASIVADDTTTSLLTFTAKDAFGNVIGGIAADKLRFVVTGHDGSTPATGKVTVSSITESATPGVYTATLKGQLADTYTIKPQFSGSDVGSLSGSVALTASSTPDGSQSAFTVEKPSIPADDNTTSTLTFTAQDAFGNAIPGITGQVKFVVTDSHNSTPATGKVTVSSIIETATPGIYTATLKGQLADTYTIKPQVNGSDVGSLSKTVTLTAGITPDGSQSAFTAAPASIPADNSTTSTLTFTAKDTFGNAIAGITADKLKFAVSGNGEPAAGKVTVSSITEATAGVYTATLQGQRVGTYTVEPQYDGSPVGSLSGAVILTANITPDGDKSTFTVDKSSIAADDSATSLLTFTAQDTFGNAIPDLTAEQLKFVITGSDGSTPATDNVTLGSITESTTTPGVYTATLKGQRADTYTIKPQVNSKDVGTLKVSVELTAGTTPDAGPSLFAASPSVITADNVETSTLTLVAKDHFGNLIPGIAGSVSFLVMPVAEGKVTVSNVSETTRGNYTATLQGTLAGTYTVVPQISGATLGGLTDTVVLKAGTTPDAGQSAFTASPASIAANGTDSSNLLLTVRDQYGNTISGIVSRLSLKVTDEQSGADAGAGITVSDLAELGTTGVYRAILKGTRTGSLKVVPQVDNAAMAGLSGTVTLTAGATDGGKSTLTVDKPSIPADDNTTSQLTFTAQDAFGNAVPGIAGQVKFVVTDSHHNTPAAGKVTLGSISETTAGVYTATLKGQQADIYTVTPQVSGSDVGTLNVSVSLTAGSTPDGSQSAFTAAPASIPADDSTTSLLTFTAKDMFGNAIAGITADKLGFTVTDSKGSAPAAGKVTVTSITESTTTPGVYTATLKGQLADTYTVTPQFSGSDVGSLSGKVTLTAGSTPDSSQSAFTAAPASIPADDSTTSLLTFTAKDTFGNAIAGITADKLSFIVTDSHHNTPATGKVPVSTITETTAGVYTATLKGQLADTYTVTPQFSGSDVGSLSGTVTLTSGAPDGTQSLFVASPKSLLADNKESSTLTLTAKDKFGNIVSGAASVLSIAVTDGNGQTPAGVTASAMTETGTPGTYTATLKGSLAGAFTLTPQYSNSAISGLSDSVTLLGVPSTAKSQFTADPDTLPADNATVSDLTLLVKDASGKAITGIAGYLSLDVKDSHNAVPAAGAVTVSSLTETGTPGVYTATLTGTLADDYTITPWFNGASLKLARTVTLTAGVPDGGHSFFMVDMNHKGIAADGVATSSLTLMLKDEYGNIVTGVVGSLSMAITNVDDNSQFATGVSIVDMTETDPGTYTATIKGTQAGNWWLKPQFSGNAIGTLRDNVILEPGAPDGDKSSFIVDKPSIVADDTTTSLLTFTPKDKFGNAIPNLVYGYKLSFIVTDSKGFTPAAGKVTVSSTTETTPGVYTVTLRGQRADTYTIKPQYDGSDVGTLNTQVTLTAGSEPSDQWSTFSLSPDTITADNVATSTLTFTAKDMFGNAIVGSNKVTFGATDSHGNPPEYGNTVDISPTTEISPGVYTATMKGTLADRYFIRPMFNGSWIGMMQGQYLTLTAGAPDAAHSGLSASPAIITADNQETSTVTLQVKDANGNGVTGIMDKLSMVVTDSSGKAPPEGAFTLSAISTGVIDGEYIATLKGTQAGTWTVKPVYDGPADLSSLSTVVVLKAGTTPDNVKSVLTAMPAEIVADGTQRSNLLLTVKDAYGNNIPGLASKLTLDVTDSQSQPATDITVSSLAEVGTTGVYQATLQGTKAGALKVVPMFNASAMGSLSTTVTLDAGAANEVQSTFAVNPASIVADDKVESTLTLTLNDAHGNAVSGIAASVNVKITGSMGTTPASDKVTVSSITESATPGVYTATLHGQLADTYTLTPQVNGAAWSRLNQNVTLTAGQTPDDGKSLFAVSPKQVVANGSDKSTLILTLRDTFGNAIGGVTTSRLNVAVTDSSHVAVDSGKVTATVFTETATPGTYTATLTGTLAGTWTLTPTLDGAAVGTLSDTVTLTPGALDTGNTTFGVNPTSVVADNETTSTLTLTAKDAFSNGITGLSGRLSIGITGLKGVPTPAQVTLGSVTETSTAGVYTVTLRGTRADTYTVQPLLDSTAIGSLSGTVTLTADPTPNTDVTTLVASPKSVVADNVATSTLTLVVKDKFGNDISGIAGRLSLVATNSQAGTPPDGSVTLSTVTETATPGTYTATLKGTLPDVYTIRPRFDTSVLAGVVETVTLKAPDGMMSGFTVSPNSIPADNVTTSTLTFTAKDAQGNIMSDIAVGALSFTVINGGGSDQVNISAVSKTGTPGTYIATLKGLLPGIYTVAPQFNGVRVGTLSAQVELKAEAFSGMTVNGYNFGLSSGFPTTGFKNAVFTLNMPVGKQASSYIWTSSQPWVTADNTGKVTFSGDASSSTKTVTITAKSASGESLAFTFTITKWYSWNGVSTDITRPANDSICAGIGAQTPPKNELVNASVYDEFGTRHVGYFWSEWGDMSTYGWATPDGYHARWYLTSDTSPNAWVVDLVGGKLGTNPTALNLCRRNL